MAALMTPNNVVSLSSYCVGVNGKTVSLAGTNIFFQSYYSSEPPRKFHSLFLLFIKYVFLISGNIKVCIKINYFVRLIVKCCPLALVIVV